MLSYKSGKFTIVFLGKLNPSILNHDFLVSNDIIPKNTEPFSSLLKKGPGKQFTDFVSTPLMAGIRYGKYHMVVEESRYQLLDETADSPSHSPIIGITKSYFRMLRYTPLRLGGFNFVGVVSFEDESDERGFDMGLGIDTAKSAELLATTSIRMGGVIRYPFKDWSCMIQINKSREKEKEALVSFNFEFQYTDMDRFLKNLDLVEDAYGHFLTVLKKLGVEVK